MMSRLALVFENLDILTIWLEMAQQDTNAYSNSEQYLPDMISRQFALSVHKWNLI